MADNTPSAEPCRLGECPIWCERTQRLWWVDVLAPTLWSYDPSSGNCLRHAIKARRIGSLALRRSGGLILACDDGLYSYDPVSAHQEFLVDPEPNVEGFRKNDGRADSAGNFWVGTLREADYGSVGSIYRVTPTLAVKHEESDLAIPNALAFDPDRGRMYFADTRAYTIWVCEYDADSGRRGEKKVFATTTAPGRPDGSCVDSEGYLWNAEYAGRRIIRFDPDGRLERSIELPVTYPTCCCFGGAKFDILFVTSAFEPLTALERQAEPLAGSVLAFRPGVRGKPEFRTAL